MKILRPNEQRAKNAITMIWIVLALEVMSLISGYRNHSLLNDIANGIEISEETASVSDTTEQILGIVYSVVFVISGIVFIRWFRRAYYNLSLLNVRLSFTEGWAAGSWFVPIIYLFRPYQIMKELYTKTKLLLNTNKINLHQDFKTNILGYWWVLWIISNLLSHFIFRYSLKVETLEEIMRLSVVSIISNIIGIPSAILAIKVVKDYSNVEPLLHKINTENKSLEQHKSIL